MIDLNAVFGALLGAPVLTLLGSAAKRWWDKRDKEIEIKVNAPVIAVKASDAAALIMERTIQTLERQRDEAWAIVDTLRGRVDTLEASMDSMQAQLRTAQAEAEVLRRELDVALRGRP